MGDLKFEIGGALYWPGDRLVKKSVASGTVRSLLLAALACVCALGTTCTDVVEPAAGPTHSLLWISLDTVRADHLSLYGYERPTTPSLDKLARQGLYFEWAVAPQNATLPSHMTMFTGYHPVVHGVMHSGRNAGIRLAPHVRTLTQVLQEHGYVARAWTDGGKVASYFGFSRGFTDYDERTIPLNDKVDEILATIDSGVDGDGPFFYFLHTYQAHAPYEAPASFPRQFVSPPTLDEAVVALDRYDCSLAFIDAEVHRLIDGLERRGLLESTIVVITGDHGENFREHGIWSIGHGDDNLFQSITRVPWIVLHPEPAYRRRRVRDLVGLIDFSNTVLPLLGLDVRMPGGGVNVLGGTEETGRSYASWSGSVWSLYSGPHHLLYSDRPKDWNRNRLFDVLDDPAERSPVTDQEEIARMQDLLFRIQDDLEREVASLDEPLHVEGDLSPELIERLKSLGYLGG